MPDLTPIIAVSAAAATGAAWLAIAVHRRTALEANRPNLQAAVIALGKRGHYDINPKWGPYTVKHRWTVETSTELAHSLQIGNAGPGIALSVSYRCEADGLLLKDGSPGAVGPNHLPPNETVSYKLDPVSIAGRDTQTIVTCEDAAGRLHVWRARGVEEAPGDVHKVFTYGKPWGLPKRPRDEDLLRIMYGLARDPRLPDFPWLRPTPVRMSRPWKASRRRIHRPPIRWPASRSPGPSGS